MNETDRLRCERLRLDSKRGQPISDEDFAFLKRMYEQHPDEYKAIGVAANSRATAEINPLYKP